jgi:multidrug efflux pump subunit AcrA (membrane-fusion protein)
MSAAYDRQAAAWLDMHAPPRAMRTLARFLGWTFLMVVFALIVVPWQQFSTGYGRVIAYAPVDRQQSIDAPIEGRVVHWYVHEGDRVNEGDPIVDISDNDPEILTRLRQERDAQLARIEAAKARIAATESRVGALDSARGSAVSGAEYRQRMAKDRIRQASQAARAAGAAHDTATLNLQRQTSLFGQGLTSKRSVELAELEEVRTRTELDRANAALSAARNDEAAFGADVSRVSMDTAAAINGANETLASARSDIAGASAELARIEVRLARQTTQAVKAPRTGSIFRVIARAQGGQIVKAGEQLAVLVPETQERAAEIWIDGNDVPLVWEGRHVRLQFEGWPAIQFAGWPSIAVGTFGGRVAFVDAADNGSGDFRVVIVPDGPDPWPKAQHLRQGMRATGWILLNRVRLGYELWRQFNGFPASIPTADMLDVGNDGSSKGDGKSGKDKK